MLRRDALKLAIGAAVGSSVSLPAVAQRHSQIRWRMTSSFAKTLDITYGAAEQFCRCVGELTEGRFIIEQFAAGELVPGLQALDAVSNGTVEMAYTAALFYVGKDPRFALGAAAPFMIRVSNTDGTTTLPATSSSTPSLPSTTSSVSRVATPACNGAVGFARNSRAWPTPGG
jgi:TRAP-type mannitol/chloroaromatic compound transport system substrate-binding protein